MSLSEDNSKKASLAKGELPFDLTLHPKLLKTLMDQVLAMLDQGLSKERDAKIQHPDYENFDATDLLEPTAPEEPSDILELLEEVNTVFLKNSTSTIRPNGFSYIPGSNQAVASVGEFMSTLFNRHVAFKNMSPAFAQMECNVIRWMAKAVGYESSGVKGFLTTGGSLANLWALVTARETRVPAELLHRAIIYGTSLTHHCLHKSMRVAAIPIRNFREVPLNEKFQMDPVALEAMIQEDRSRGYVPLFISAAAGTTDMGTVDPLEEISVVAKKHRVWLHVDGAYGGLFNITKQGAKTLKGISEANSVVVDPHKTLFMPYGLGCVLIKEGDLLKKAYYAHQGPYLPERNEEQEDVSQAWSFHSLTPELSRDFRGLRIWLPIKAYGFKKYRELLSEKLELTQYAHTEIQKNPKVKIFSPPSLSVFTFYISKGGAEDDENVLTKKVYQDIAKRGEVFMTATVFQGRFLIRVCVLNSGTKKKHIDQMIEQVNFSIKQVGSEQ